MEDVLNRMRLYRELLGERVDAVVDGISGTDARDLDRAVCSSLYKWVALDPPRGIQPHIHLASWLGSTPRQVPVEVFSTNYDLLIERGLEAAQVPYFDGFIGSVNPYFSNAASDVVDDKYSGIPHSWVRLWKLHGSIGWRDYIDPDTFAPKVVRRPLSAPTAADDLIIFPSRDKYSDARRLPFITLHDRLRRLTSSGEALLLVAGYSFGDRHINDIIFDNLRANNRLSATVLLFDGLDSSTFSSARKRAAGIRNLTVYAPDRAIVGGVEAPWEPPPLPLAGHDQQYWDARKGTFSLGDFNAFSHFLTHFVGAPSQPAAAAAAASRVP
ncbi:MAG: SIR2 family protein [Terriglobales bacterium]